MKKRTFMGVMALIAAMILSVGGTCFAQDTVFIDVTLSGTSRMNTGLAYSLSTSDADGARGIDTSGATTYGILSAVTGPMPFPTSARGAFGATPWAASDLDANADDILDVLAFAPAPAGMPAYWSSSTAFVQPTLISGETNAYVVSIQAGYNHGVDNGFVAGNVNNGMTGTTIAMIDGATMAINWAFPMPENAQFYGGSSVFYLTGTGASRYYNTPLTVWTPGTVLDTTGATIYGTSGASASAAAGPGGGASVWALTNWGALITNGTTTWPIQAYGGAGSNARLNVSDGLAAKVSVSGLSGFVASPVISGESIFYVGTNGAGGITVYQLDKDDLGGFTAGAQNAVGGVIYAATVKPVGVAQLFSDQFMPTPVTVTNPNAPAGTSGVSLVVVCNQGGVTIYDTADLGLPPGQAGRTIGQLGQNGAGTAGSFLLPAATFTGVTASPVVWERNTDGDLLADPYIIFCGTSAVTCYQVSNGLATNTRAWWYDFAANVSPAAQIWGTPAVSNGFVYVPIVWGANGTIFVFDIDAGNNTFVARHDLNGPIFSDPIVVRNEVWGISQGNAAQSVQLYRWEEDGLGRAFGNPYWTQFKFDAGKTGANTLLEEDRFVPGDDDTCFISTIK
jgi:hypothetical protein